MHTKMISPERLMLKVLNIQQNVALSVSPHVIQ